MDTEHRSEESDEPIPPRSSGGVTPVRARGGGTAERELRALYDAHALALLGYALRLCNGDRAMAEDLVQETLVRAWRHLDRLDPSAAPVRPWLFTVAQHLAVDAHRARPRARRRWATRRSRPCRASTRSKAPWTGSSSPTRSSRCRPNTGR